MSLYLWLLKEQPDHANEYNALLNACKHGITLEIGPLEFSRTREQEKYYRKWCGHFAKHCGMTPDEMHDEMLCETFGSCMVNTRFGYRRRPEKRSGDTTRADYGVLIDTLIRVAADMDFIVPPPVRKAS